MASEPIHHRGSKLGPPVHPAVTHVHPIPLPSPPSKQHVELRCRNSNRKSVVLLQLGVLWSLLLSLQSLAQAESWATLPICAAKRPPHPWTTSFRRPRLENPSTEAATIRGDGADHQPVDSAPVVLRLQFRPNSL
ncbi:uncharacterized protein LOC121467653 [Drosophila elegans]|uniref:uncharacterized protein LOC121467653 n=1 Tax=Drosophila elegans TaxID=30023 RepID=UPI001BC8461A|nr:uncharacterized protein LOC121467653 [Drosophila elegans]